jgi:hypothetical protein
VLVSAEPLWSRGLVNLLKHSAKPARGNGGWQIVGLGDMRRVARRLFPLATHREARWRNRLSVACIGTRGTKSIRRKCPGLEAAGHVNKHFRGMTKIMI